MRSHVFALLSRSIPFLGIDIVIALWGAVDGVILSKLMTEVEVGVYGAAGQLLQPVALVYRSIVGSVFPAMCRRAAASKEQLIAFTRWMLAFLLLIGLPVTVLIPVFADQLLMLAYGADRFTDAIPVIRIAAFGLIAHSFTVVLGHTLWAANCERATLRIVIINFALNVVISTIGIYFFGILGAACGSLAVVLFNVFQHCWALMKIQPLSPIDYQIVPPLLAAAAMLLTVGALYETNRLMASAIGVAVYLAVAGGLLVARHGSLRNCRNRFFAPLAQ